MSYIRCSDNYSSPYYIPTENLQGLFKNLVVQPFEERPRTLPWINLVKNKDFKYHREEILDQGRTNFDEWHEGLSPKDKVALYCIHYMPMHLFSSYHIFTKHLNSMSNRVVFIDFGCGPLTSGIAFWASARQSNMIYLGIDSSQAMLNKAKEINQYGPNQGREPFFKNFQAIDSYHKLISLLDYYIKKGDRTQIIFNFCYFLASKTIDIGDLSEHLTQIVEKYHQHKMCIVYQNPPLPEIDLPLKLSFLHKNWTILKDNLSVFTSRVTEPNVVSFCYNSLIYASQHNTSVHYDILSNESFNVSNDLLPF